MQTICSLVNVPSFRVRWAQTSSDHSSSKKCSST
nr:MAG TPA: hypothetical protein [Caudoviricetes sp.]